MRNWPPNLHSKSTFTQPHYIGHLLFLFSTQLGSQTFVRVPSKKRGVPLKKKEDSPKPIMLEKNTGRGRGSKSKSTLDPRRIDPRPCPPRGVHSVFYDTTRVCNPEALFGGKGVPPPPKYHAPTPGGTPLPPPPPLRVRDPLPYA